MSDSINEQIRKLGADRSLLCARPWTTLEERSLVGDYQICCFTPSILGVIHKDEDADLMSLWNGPVMTATRRAFAARNYREYCPPDCPTLVRKTEVDSDYIGLYEYDPAEYETLSAEFRENRQKVLDSIVAREEQPDTYPIKLKLHPSNICNLDCRMCNLDKRLQRKIGEGYYRNAYRLMPYLEELVIFGGEPFACPATRGIVFGDEIRKHPQLHVSTISNAALLDEKILEKLKGLRLGWFSFSLDSVNPETYPQIRVNADFRRTFANVERFVRARDNGDIRIRKITALFVIQKLNYAEITECVEWAHGLGIESAFSFVTGTHELLGHTDKVRKHLEAGIARAEALGEPAVAGELRKLQRSLPEYTRQLRKQKVYFSLFKVVDRERVVSFLQKHNRLKRVIRKVMGI